MEKRNDYIFREGERETCGKMLEAKLSRNITYTVDHMTYSNGERKNQ